MAKLPVRWIEVRTYCHATEDEARVAQALDAVCPVGETVRESLEGHFGNPLLRLTRRVDDGKAIRSVWDRWTAAGLPQDIGRDLESRLDDDGILHFRIDKQAACLEKLALARDADTIDVRLKLMAFPAKRDVAKEVARSVLAGGP
ncbi:MAG TPA: RNA-binding domain-containing protein [Thermoplasmata archaeon]